MNYIIPIEKEIDFSRAEKAMISNYKWTEGYSPEAYAQLICILGRGFALRMTCKEVNPKAVYTNYNDPVYKDSCMEFFASFNPESNKYMNFEMNSNGAFLAAVRTERANKTPIDTLAPLPEVKAVHAEDGWSVEVFFSNELIGALFGKDSFKSGESFKGNFYKCGDDMPQKHYLSWNPIGTERPNFHTPQYFGELYFE